ncbi:MAG: hypothetical protein L0Z53_07510 [Acidobacteriales bacterium]|nr:hypothetical protein [Terriglobales bacterium]
MTDTIFLATSTGLAICQREPDTWRVVDRVLKDQHVTSVIAREGVILAGTTRGIQRSDDGGQHWRGVNDGLTSPHVRWLAYHPDISDLEFAGTEPAGIFVSRDGAEHWSARPQVAALRDEHDWMLPYSPQAGCVRGFAVHGQRLYAAVEVGGVLRSDDAGQSWALAAGSDGNPDLSGPPEPFVYPDIHDIAVHPSNPDLVFAATGGGFYRSDDGGVTWALVYDCYCRTLWLDPDNPAHIIFGPADRVGAVGRIEESHDGGQTWHLASGGLDVPWPRTMPERIKQIDDELFTVLDDGRLLVAPLATLDWKFIDVGRVNAVTAMQD